MECRDFIFSIEENIDKGVEKFPSDFRKHYEECETCRKTFLEQQAVHRLLKEGKKLLQQEDKVVRISPKRGVVYHLMRVAIVLFLLWGTYKISFTYFPAYFQQRGEKLAFHKSVVVKEQNVNKKENKVVKAISKKSSPVPIEKKNTRKENQVTSSEPIFIAKKEDSYWKVTFSKNVYDKNGMVYLQGKTYKFVDDRFKREQFYLFSQNKIKIFDFTLARIDEFLEQRPYFYQFSGFKGIIAGDYFLEKDFFYPLREKCTLLFPGDELLLKLSTRKEMTLNLVKGWNIISNSTYLPLHLKEIVASKDIFSSVVMVRNGEVTFYKDGYVYPGESCFVYAYKYHEVKISGQALIGEIKDNLLSEKGRRLVLSLPSGLRFTSFIMLEKNKLIDLPYLPVFPLDWEGKIAGYVKYGKAKKFTVSNIFDKKQAFKLAYFGNKGDKILIFDPYTGEKYNLPYTFILDKGEKRNFYFAYIGRGEFF